MNNIVVLWKELIQTKEKHWYELAFGIACNRPATRMVYKQYLRMIGLEENDSALNDVCLQYLTKILE